MAIDQVFYLDLDALIDSSVATALVEDGFDPKLVQARSETRVPTAALAVKPSTTATRIARWTEEESAFVRDNLGYMSMEEMSHHLGRSVDAIKVHWTRRGYDAPSRQPGDIVLREVGDMMGMCGKTVKMLVVRGILPGRPIAGSGRGIHVVNRLHLYKWVVQPANWIYFKVERIRDLKIKRLVLLRQSQWDDEWWTTGQVADYHGTISNMVAKHIREGKLPAVRWQNYRVLKSDAIKHTFYMGKGSNVVIEWSAEGDAFMLLATAVGLPTYITAQMMGEEEKRIPYRVGVLTDDRRKLKKLITAYDLPIQVRGKDLFTDWRRVDDRFPGLVRAIDKFTNTKQELSYADCQCLRGVMRSWATWHGAAGEKFMRQLTFGRMAKRPKLTRYYDMLLGAGVDPFWPMGKSK